MKILPALLALAMLPGCLGEEAPPPSPYAAETWGEVRGLTPEEIEGLKTGAGMRLALPAELNGWPGPKHVLELAEELDLTRAQELQIEAERERMLAAAVPAGARVLAAHAALEQAFRDGDMDAARLADLVADLAAAEGELRRIHLASHLATAEVLTPEQRDRYDVLRGYEADETHAHRGH